MSSTRRLLEWGSALVQPIPIGLLDRMSTAVGRAAARGSRAKLEVLRRNLERIVPDADESEVHELALRGFGSYGRYWGETLRLPTLGADVIDGRFSVEGREHLLRTREEGYGPIVVLPHLGGWEWAAAWLTRVDGIPVTAVVERLRPPDVFEWFVDLRSSYGIRVVPVGPEAMAALTTAVRERHVVCLLADRDLSRRGLPVEFFGAPTTLPAGPALLSMRTGAPVHVTAVYFTDSGHHCIVGPPIRAERRGGLREDAQVFTQRIAVELEALIRRAPEQWHVLEPLWAEPAGVNATAGTA